MKVILFFFLFLITLSTTAQQKNFTTLRNWSKHKTDFFFGLRYNLFMGDVGGINPIQSVHKFSDVSFVSNSFGAQGGYRFRFHPYWATSSRIQIGQLRGNDALMNNDLRQARNIHFRSAYAEISQRLEFIAFAHEQGEARFIIKKRRDYQLYTYLGIGLLVFNPQAEYKYTWLNLHSLRTEGQGLAGGPSPYKRITASIPLGFGFKTILKDSWSIRFELEYSPTFTDYLDDVGGVYYNSQLLANELGEAAAYLSNPSTNNSELFTTGKSRGNKQLDGFFSFSMLLSKNTTYKYYSKAMKLREKRKKTGSEKGNE